MTRNPLDVPYQWLYPLPMTVSSARKAKQQTETSNFHERRKDGNFHVESPKQGGLEDPEEEKHCWVVGEGELVVGVAREEQAPHF